MPARLPPFPPPPDATPLITPRLQEFAELLVAKGASASHRDSAGASVLVHAAHARMPKVVKALLAGTSGVDKDAASDEGVTALIAAAMKVLYVVGGRKLNVFGRSGVHVVVSHVDCLPTMHRDASYWFVRYLMRKERYSWREMVMSVARALTCWA